MRKKGRLKNKIKKIEKKIIKEKEMTKKEILLNVPTFLNALRIALTFVVVYMIMVGKDITHIVVVFAIAAITDWFDGRIARKYQLVNPFGAKADMVADRFLWVGTALAIIFVFGANGLLDNTHGILLLMMMIREIICFPFAIIAFMTGGLFPPARKVAKITTFLQGFGFPALMLSIFYPLWIYFVIPIAVITFVTGILSGLYYAGDTRKIRENASP